MPCVNFNQNKYTELLRLVSVLDKNMANVCFECGRAREWWINDRKRYGTRTGDTAISSSALYRRQMEKYIKYISNVVQNTDGSFFIFGKGNIKEKKNAKMFSQDSAEENGTLTNENKCY